MLRLSRQDDSCAWRNLKWNPDRDGTQRVTGPITVHPIQGIMPPMLLRRRGRVVDCGGLENRCPLTGTVGSNPTASAKRSTEPPNGFARVLPATLPKER